MTTGPFKKLSVSLPISITWTDYPSVGDCAVIVYFTGCGHKCPGCQNPELQDSDTGTYFMYNELADMIMEEAEKAHTKKVVFSGGDAYFQPSVEINLLVHTLNESGYEICIYTGAGIKEVYSKIPYATYYKCGKYDEQDREREWGKFPDKMVFVSRNQKLYNNKCKLVSVDNVFYFRKRDTFKARVRKLLKRG